MTCKWCSDPMPKYRLDRHSDDFCTRECANIVAAVEAAVLAERERHMNPKWTCPACGVEQRGFIVCGMCGKSKPRDAALAPRGAAVPGPTLKLCGRCRDRGALLGCMLCSDIAEASRGAATLRAPVGPRCLRLGCAHAELFHDPKCSGGVAGSCACIEFLGSRGAATPVRQWKDTMGYWNDYEPGEEEHKVNRVASRGAVVPGPFAADELRGFNGGLTRAARMLRDLAGNADTDTEQRARKALLHAASRLDGLKVDPEASRGAATGEGLQAIRNYLDVAGTGGTLRRMRPGSEVFDDGVKPSSAAAPKQEATTYLKRPDCPAICPGHLRAPGCVCVAVERDVSGCLAHVGGPRWQTEGIDDRGNDVRDLEQAETRETPHALVLPDGELRHGDVWAHEMVDGKVVTRIVSRIRCDDCGALREGRQPYNATKCPNVSRVRGGCQGRLRNIPEPRAEDAQPAVDVECPCQGREGAHDHPIHTQPGSTGGEK